MFAHVIIGFAVAFITLLFAIPIIQQFSIPASETVNMIQRHYIIGVVLMALIILQVVMGFISNILKRVKNSSTTAIFAFNTAHKYVGYVLVFLAKFQVYFILDTNGDHPDRFWIYLGIDISSFIALIIRKVFFPTMAQTVMPDYSEVSCQRVSSVRDLKRSSSEPVGVFANYIYDLSNLTFMHPAGYKIIESIKYRDFDRYLYGMYRTER